MPLGICQIIQVLMMFVSLHKVFCWLPVPSSLSRYHSNSWFVHRLSSQNSCWNWTTWDRILSITQTYPNQWLVEVFPQWFYDVEAGHFITPCWLWLFNRVESPLLIPLTLSFSWIISPYFHDCLVGGFNHLEKYACQLGWLFPIYGKS